MTNLPAGTVTFLFTDIEGSTKISQDHPESWETLRGRHHEILRSAIEAQNGHVFQIVGDEFCAAFHTAPDALKAALTAQQLLQSEDWKPAPVKVRMGINTGAAQVGTVNDASGGYTGYLALARVNRVMSAGHGGQILLSSTSAELVRGELSEGVRLRDMGEHRLKGLLNLEHLWQVEAPDLARDFPPLKTLNAIPNNLPSQLTSFIGRGKEIAAVKQELTQHRLVTLVGPGGTGKSRLSLQVAADVLDMYPDGVWFVELASLSDPELVPQTILSTLSLSEQKGKTALQTLEDHLRDKKLLFLLDNCEHLIEACAQTTQAILKASSAVSILASSRESLGVSGEVSWHVPSLSLPNPKNLPDVDQLNQYEAVRLFIDRVQLVSPRFAVTKENASAIAQICYRLDGIPLALELAAARARSMSVEQIMTRLDDRFRLLTGGSRTALPRQQTLRALIDWSYDLLTDDEKLLLRRLAVFAGGWTLEFAEQICADDKLDSLDILDMLAHLVDKSLVAAEEEHGNMRYRILETVRQYAREKLFESGEGVDMRNRHRDAFLALVEKAGPELRRENDKLWFQILDAEQENVRSALWWSLETQQASIAMRMCLALYDYWDWRQLWRESTNFFSETLALVEKDEALTKTAEYVLLVVEKLDQAIAVTLNLQTDSATFEAVQKACALLEDLHFPQKSWVGFYLLANLHMVRGDIEAAGSVLLKLLQGARAAGQKDDIAWALWRLSDLYNRVGETEKADRVEREARDMFLKIGDRKTALYAAVDLLMRDFYRGNMDIAARNLDAAYDDAKALESPLLIKRILSESMEMAWTQGDYELAEKRLKEFEAVSRASPDTNWDHLYIRLYKAKILYCKGEPEQACQLFKAILDLAEEMQWNDFSGYTMGLYGLALLRVGRLEEARANFENGLAQMEKVGLMTYAGYSHYGLGECERMSGNLPASLEKYQKAFYLRNKRQEYVCFPQLMEGLAKLSLLQGDPIRSARWFGCADELRRKFSIAILTVDRPDYDKHIDLLKQKMSAEEFQSSWAEGAKMDMEEVITLALQGYAP